MRRAPLALLAALGLASCGGASSQAPAPRPAEPAQAPANRAIVWAVGDGADGSPIARKLARLIAADQPDRFLYLGDVYPSGTATRFPAPLRAGVRAPGRDHLADHRQPRVG